MKRLRLGTLMNSCWNIMSVLLLLLLLEGAEGGSEGMRLIQEGKLEDAAVAFARQAQESSSPYDYYNLALTYAQMGATDKVADALNQAVIRAPTFANAWVNFGVFFQQSEELKMAFRCYQIAVRTSKGQDQALPWYNLGSMLLRSGDIPKTHAAFLAATKANPSLAVAVDGLGSVYMKRGEQKKAQIKFQEAIHLQPDIAESYFNLGSIDRGRGNWQKALEYLSFATKAQSKGSSSPVIFWAQVYNNLGGALHALGQYNESLPEFDKSIRLVPGMVMAHVNKGEALRIMGRWQDAIACTRTAISLDLDHGVALSNHLMYKQNICDWEDWARLFQHLTSLVLMRDTTHADTSEEPLPTISPYQAITFPFNMVQTLGALMAYARDVQRKSRKIAVLFKFTPPSPVGPTKGCPLERLRVAYMSSDYGDHTTGVNVVGIFKEHDRSRVHAFAYALSPSDGSKIRKRTETEVETFRDFHDLSTAQIAFAINADGIHILVDFNGHTLGARSEVIALRPAPVTMFDQGFAGSSGGIATHFNADKVSLPPEYTGYYTERIMYMPFFSNPLNDFKSSYPEVANKKVTLKQDFPRQDIDLPEKRFTFACFNTAYKYSEKVMDSWANLLEEVPNSTLWLLRWPDMEGNIKKESRKRGLREDAIVFTDVLPLRTHLSWKAANTDLFLDTFAFNGHGTVSQMLWSGVPSLTMPLERIGQRIGAAVVMASAANGTLVARNEEDYVDIAWALAQDGARHHLEGIKASLQLERLRVPLFDIARYVRDYERLLLIMWDAEHSNQWLQQCKKDVKQSSTSCLPRESHYHSIVSPSQ